MIFVAAITFVVVIFILCLSLSKAERKDKVKQRGRAVGDVSLQLVLSVILGQEKETGDTRVQLSV